MRHDARCELGTERPNTYIGISCRCAERAYAAHPYLPGEEDTPMPEPGTRTPSRYTSAQAPHPPTHLPAQAPTPTPTRQGTPAQAPTRAPRTGTPTGTPS